MSGHVVLCERKARLLLTQLERLRNSGNGNPRYRLGFADGTAYATQPDAADNYNVSEAMVGKWVEIEVRGNRIVHIKEA